MSESSQPMASTSYTSISGSAQTYGPEAPDKQMKACCTYVYMCKLCEDVFMDMCTNGVRTKGLNFSLIFKVPLHYQRKLRKSSSVF